MKPSERIREIAQRMLNGDSPTGHYPLEALTGETQRMYEHRALLQYLDEQHETGALDPKELGK